MLHIPNLGTYILIGKKERSDLRGIYELVGMSSFNSFHFLFD